MGVCDGRLNRPARVIFLCACVWHLLLSAGCVRSGTPPVGAAFYYWQGRFVCPPALQAYLDSLQVGRLFVRLFDVDWDPALRQAVPVAVTDMADSLPARFALVPVVFVTNRTFGQLDDAGVDSLADRLYRKVASMMPSGRMPALVQLDCDWTAGTRARYFRLLGRIGQRLHADGARLSVTIRLHQLKYPGQTGVPPADEGGLMFYNMGDVDDPAAGNTILDLDVAQAYLRDAGQYPLPLEVALPLFSWGAVIREGRVVRLINGLDAAALDGDSLRFGRSARPDRRVVRTDTYLQGYFLYAGDELRLESASAGQLRQAAAMLAPHFRNRPNEVLFFHLDTTLMRRFPADTLKSVLAVFSK